MNDFSFDMIQSKLLKLFFTGGEKMAVTKEHHQQINLKLGDTVFVHIAGEETEEEMLVTEASKPKVITQIGRVQLIETSFKLKSSTPE
jgi:hypothetical protein